MFSAEVAYLVAHKRAFFGAVTLRRDGDPGATDNANVPSFCSSTPRTTKKHLPVPARHTAAAQEFITADSKLIHLGIQQ